MQSIACSSCDNDDWWYFHKNIRLWVENECCCPHTINISKVNFIWKYLYRQREYYTWDSKYLALIAQVVRAFGMNSKVGGFESPSGRDIFSLNRRHFHKNIRSWVKNECWCPRTVDISNVKFT